MGRLLNPDNSFFSAVRKILYMIELSFAWIICSIPLVTIGASTSALYYAVAKAVRKDRSYPLREFFKAWKLNLKRGTAITVMLSAVGCMSFFADMLIGAGFWELRNLADCVMCGLFVLKTVVFLGVIGHIFPLLSRFDTTVLKLMETAVLLSIRHCVRTICMIALFMVLFILLRAESGFLIILPSLYCLLISYLLEPMFQKYYDKQEIEAKRGKADVWYAEEALRFSSVLQIGSVIEKP